MPSMSLIPGLMPRIFTSARAANSTMSRTARNIPAPSGGQNTPTEPANAVATEATDKHAVAQYKNPPMNAAYPPKATSM